MIFIIIGPHIMYNIIEVCFIRSFSQFLLFTITSFANTLSNASVQSLLKVSLSRKRILHSSSG